MITVTIPLSDLIVDLDHDADVADLPADQALKTIQQCYTFLPGPLEVALHEGTATIRSLKPPSKSAGDAPGLFERANKHAKSGSYQRAIEVFSRVLERMPEHLEARRNLAMAHLESGNLDLAKKYLVEATRLDPNDEWSYLLLANLYAKHEDDPEKAARFYQRAYAINPRDPYLLTSYGGTLIKVGKEARGRELLEQAKEIDPSYPNAYYGIAFVDAQDGKFDAALATLDELFARPPSSDPRSAPVYQAARDLYLKACQEKVESSPDAMMDVLDERRKGLEAQTGHPIEISEDPSLTVSAVTQMAWNYETGTHRIRYQNKVPALTPHHLAHELEHISLEYEARTAGRNRAFATTIETREHALRSIGDHINKLTRQGFPESEITDVILQMVSGQANQLFNIPLDMVIEYRIHQQLEALRPSQVLSLHAAMTESALVFEKPEIRKLSPPLIFESSTALNCAYALFTDHLYQGRTDYAKVYEGSGAYATGQKIFELWQSMIGDYQHGDEYKFVDACADVLDLRGWYVWKNEGAQPAPSLPVEAPPETPTGTTNPELLKSKDMASVMYCLAALQRFEKMDRQETFAIATEIALLGQSGIDYADVDRRYHLRSTPGESFSGLQLLALMYVAFKKVDPSVETALDLKDAYQAALQIYEDGSTE